MTRFDCIRTAARAYLRAKNDFHEADGLPHSPCHDYDESAYRLNVDTWFSCLSARRVAQADLERAVFSVCENTSEFTMTLDGHVFGFKDGGLEFISPIHAVL